MDTRESSLARRLRRLATESGRPDLNELASLAEELDRRHQRVLMNQELLEESLLRIENSILFRMARGAGAWWQGFGGRLGQWILHSPLHALIRARPAALPVASPAADRYAPPPGDWTIRPAISVVMAVHDSRLDWLEQAILSVETQTYPACEICIAIDAASSRAVRLFLERRAAETPLLRLAADSEDDATGISATLNRAAALARGDYLAFLDHDDRLAPHALDAVAGQVQQSPADLIYSDEDWMSEDGRLLRPNLKPDYSPDLLLSCMYMGHMLVVARESFQQLGGFRAAFDGAQDYDLALRLTANPSAVVRHVPDSLYHWRSHKESTAASAGAKPTAHESGRRALEDALAARGIEARAADGPEPHTYRVVRVLEHEPFVSILICSRDMGLLRRCLAAIEARTRYPWREIILAYHASAATGSGTVPENVRVIPYHGPFDFATMNNLCAARARGDVLVLLNDDIEPLNLEWLEALLGHLSRPEVGVVGAKLVYPRGNLQHAGLVTGIMDGVGHAGRGLYSSDVWRWLDLTRDVAAVTGACLAVRREVFFELGALDPSFPVNYNDVDLCLRAHEAGYRVICEPAAVLRHWEARSRERGTRVWERERFFERWSGVLARTDPYYSPRLEPSREVPTLRTSSSAGRWPWEAAAQFPVSPAPIVRNS